MSTQSITNSKVHIRWMILRDSPEVQNIEDISYQLPWNHDDFMRVLRQTRCVANVAELNENVVGYFFYELHKKYLDILNFTVHPAFRRKKIGTQMINKLIAKLSSHNRSRLTMTVRESNLAAQLFLQASGFKAVRVHRNFYEDTDEDAYVMKFTTLLPVEAESAHMEENQWNV